MSKDVYKTKDLGEAAALYAVGIKLLRLEKRNEFYLFVFDANKAEVTANSYWSGELTLIAKTYNDSLRTLKERIFSQQSTFKK